jgi:hypothetical protein
MSNQLILSLDDGAVFSYAENNFAGCDSLFSCSVVTETSHWKMPHFASNFGLQKKRETAETASMRRAFLDFIDEGLDSVSTPEYPL